MGTVLGAIAARRALGEPARSLPYPFTPLSAVPFNAGNAVRLIAASLTARLRRGKAAKSRAPDNFEI
jgi:hypothetical protein